MSVAVGSFDVALSPAAPELGGAVARFELRKTFRGDLDGVGEGIMLSVGEPAAGAAGYVAVETVDGALHGRRGTFSLAQLGTMHGGAQTLSYVVVPGSGTGELEGITGRMQLDIEADGTHRFRLTYDL